MFYNQKPTSEEIENAFTAKRLYDLGLISEIPNEYQVKPKRLDKEDFLPIEILLRKKSSKWG